MTRPVRLTLCRGTPWRIPADRVVEVTCGVGGATRVTTDIIRDGEMIAEFVIGTVDDVAALVWPESIEADRVTAAAREALTFLDWNWPKVDPAEPSDMRDLIADAKAAATILRAALGGAS